jgi:hypothetical protein
VTVSYQFFADSSYGAGPWTSVSGSFTYVANDFIRSDLTVPVAELFACSVTAVPADPPAVCGDMSFAPGAYGYDAVGFGIPTPTGGVGVAYYFQPGAFSASGSYSTVVFGADQSGRLLVTAVPEPASAVMLLTGLMWLGKVWLRMKHIG